MECSRALSGVYRFRGGQAGKIGDSQEHDLPMGLAHFFVNGCPSWLAKLVNISSVSLWFMVDISMLIWFINQLITGGAPPCVNVYKRLPHPSPNSQLDPEKNNRSTNS